jgi:hypothetical protein
VALLALLAVFDLIGAAMAYLISYDELSRHYAGRGPARREAARRAFVALLFLLVLSVAIVLVLRAAGA